MHAEASWYQVVASGWFGIFEKLDTKAQAEGIDLGLVQALHSAQLSQAECDYEKHLYGFLAQNLLQPSMPECADLAWARVKAARVAALALPAKIR